MDEPRNFVMRILDWELDVSVLDFEVKEDDKGGYLSFNIDYDKDRIKELKVTHDEVGEKVGEIMIIALEQHVEENS